jgi:hypothetical protein
VTNLLAIGPLRAVEAIDQSTTPHQVGVALPARHHADGSCDR